MEIGNRQALSKKLAGQCSPGRDGPTTVEKIAKLEVGTPLEENRAGPDRATLDSSLTPGART